MVYRDDRRFYFGAEVGLESNGTEGELTFMNTRWNLSGEWRTGFNKEKGFETESHFGRYIDRNQFLMLYAGWDYRYRDTDEIEYNIFNQISTKNERGVLCFGFNYVLPLFLQLNVRVDHTGYFRVGLLRDDIAITKRIRMWGMYNSDKEYAVGMRYIITKYISASTHYDSDLGLGVGLTLTY